MKVPAAITQGIPPLSFSGRDRLAPVAYGMITICQVWTAGDTVPAEGLKPSTGPAIRNPIVGTGASFSLPDLISAFTWASTALLSAGLPAAVSSRWIELARIV